jgi:hypothetical protein
MKRTMRMTRSILSPLVALEKPLALLAAVLALGGLLALVPGASADEIADDFEIPVPADRAEPVPPAEPMATPEPVAPPQPVARAPEPARMNPYLQECCADDDYDDSQSHPLRVAAYFINPVGYGLEWLIFRPMHWVVSRPSLINVFGHDCHEGDVGCRYAAR